MIRQATGADIPQLVEWMARFREASETPVPFDPDHTARFLGGLIGAGVVLTNGRGMIGGMIAPAFCSGKWLQAHELFWWAESGGLALLRAFEAWAKGQGAAEVRMSSLASLPRAGAVLSRKGYAATELSYSKVL